MSRFAVQVRGRFDHDPSGQWVTLATSPRNAPGAFTRETPWDGQRDNAAFAAFKARQYYERPIRVLDLAAPREEAA